MVASSMIMHYAYLKTPLMQKQILVVNAYFEMFVVGT